MRRTTGRPFPSIVVFFILDVAFAPATRTVVRGVPAFASEVVAGTIAVARRRRRSHSGFPKASSGPAKPGSVAGTLRGDWAALPKSEN